MKKGIIMYIVLVCIFDIFLEPVILDEDTLSIICCIFPLIIVLCYSYISKTCHEEKEKNESLKVKREREYVAETSEKIKKIVELNKEYELKELDYPLTRISNPEYSRKSLERLTGEDILKYHIENNINFLREDIEKAVYNNMKLEQYYKEVNKIKEQVLEYDIDIDVEDFKIYEDEILESLIYSKDKYLLNIVIEAFYESTRGYTYNNKYWDFDFEDILKIYNDWKKGKKFQVTPKRERQVMNSSIRYNVFKRDNYTCQICGATAKDGAKLQVDHIIPVSKGGKTVMSNLQTLCDRCNMGKSNKTDEDIMCPDCGGLLVKRKGKYGNFIGCSNYPDCRYTRKLKVK